MQKEKKWEVTNVEVHTSYAKEHKKECERCEESDTKIDTFTREIRFEGNLDEKQINKLLEIADKCPVHRTLHSETQIVTSLV